MHLSSDLLDRTLWGHAAQDWLLGLAVFVGVSLVLRLCTTLVRVRLGRVARRTATHFDDLVVATIGRTNWLFYLGIGALAGARATGLEGHERDVLDKVVTLLVLLQVGLWLQTAITQGTRAWTTRVSDRGGQTFSSAISFVLHLAVWSILFLTALANLGVQITALVASLGIGGIAAALAVQATLGDLMASMSIYLDRPFDLGDFIIVGDFMGSVQKIGLRTTRVASLGGEELVFPNSELTGNTIRNYGRMQKRRVVFKLGVEYSTRYEQLEAIPGVIRSIIEGVEGTTFDRSHFSAYGDSSLDFETVYYVESPDYNKYMDIQQTINLAIFKAFGQRGIGFAFPTRTLHLASTPAAPALEAAARRPGAGPGAADAGERDVEA